MIGGKTRITDYDEFEEYIDSLIGNIAENRGLSFYFYSLHETFKLSELGLKESAENYRQELQKLKENDHEVWYSYVYANPTHELSLNPMLHILYQAHFITVHSELESTWREILFMYNKYRLSTSASVLNIDMKLNDQILTKLPKASLLETSISKYPLLNNTYNYVRNKIVHQSWKLGAELSDLQTKISNNEINHLQINVDGLKITGIITSQVFIKEYTHLILEVLTNIRDIAYNRRKLGNLS